MSFMTDASSGPEAMAPALLCFDGSEDAAAAIAQGAKLLKPQRAVVLTVCEPVAVWEPYDPATILNAPLAKIASTALGLDEALEEVAREKMEQGLTLARRAGLGAEGRVAKGKAWRVICQVAAELGAEPIVMGARGLSRVQSALLGSVSSAVLAHAGRPVLVIPHRHEG